MLGRSVCTLNQSHLFYCSGSAWNDLSHFANSAKSQREFSKVQRVSKRTRLCLLLRNNHQEKQHRSWVTYAVSHDPWKRTALRTKCYQCIIHTATIRVRGDLKAALRADWSLGVQSHGQSPFPATFRGSSRTCTQIYTSTSNALLGKHVQSKHYSDRNILTKKYAVAPYITNFSPYVSQFWQHKKFLSKHTADVYFDRSSQGQKRHMAPPNEVGLDKLAHLLNRFTNWKRKRQK